MESLSVVLFLSIITPLSMILLVFEGKTRTVTSFLMLGIVVCLLSGEISGLIARFSGLDRYYLTINITPVVEEILKALPVLFFAFVFRPSRRQLMECALVMGIGFAILENTVILASNTGFLSPAFALTRGFGAGMMHGICTLAVGYGLSFIEQDRRFALPGTISLLAVAIMYHSTYNCLVQSSYQMYGILLPLVTYIVLIVFLKKRKTSPGQKKPQ